MSEPSESPLPEDFVALQLPRGMEMDTPPPHLTSDYDSANNVTPSPPPLESFPTSKKYGGRKSDIQVNHGNCKGGHNTFSDSVEEEEDNQSLCNSSSSKDSGCDKSSRGGSPRNNSITNNGKSTPSKVDQDLDSSSTLLWGASLLYYTGLPSPKVKEHHFTSASPTTSYSSSYSFFGRKIRSSYSMSDMNRSSLSPFKKFNTLPKSPSKDSGTGSSVITVDGGGGGSGSNEGGETLSPLRKRHASCSSSSSTASTGMMSSLKGRIKSNTTSLRLLKVSRPSLPSFMERTQSLPRTKKNQRVCEEIAGAAAEAAIPEGTAINQQDSGISTGPEMSKSSGSSSSLKSARKALRHSFKAARSLLPGSSSSASKISPSEKTSKKASQEKTKVDGQLQSDDNEAITQFMASNSNESTDPMPSSAPNTPNIKKSRLERARKRFASTLSLHSNNNHDASSGKGSHRSKSVSTLAISDSEIQSAPHGVVSNVEGSISVENLGDCEVLAVVQDSSCSKSNKDEVVVSKKGDGSSSSSSRSPFRFIGRSRNKAKAEKSDSATAAVPNEGQQNAGFEIQEQHKHTATSTQGEAIDIRQDETDLKEKLPQAEDSTGKEKPKKKRISIVKSIGKAIRSGKGSSKEANVDPVIVNKTSTSTLMMESETIGDVNTTQEILTFDNEPRVRTPKALRKHRLKSGSDSTSSSGAGGAPTSTQQSSLEGDKDREIHELEVSETAIDISPRKLSHLLKAMAPVTSTQSKASTNGQKTHDNDNNRPTTTVDDDYDRDIINDSKPVSPDEERGSSSKRNSEPIQLTRKLEEQKKKTKSQSLITSLVSSSTSEKKGNNSVDDSKNKKKKSSKKSKKKSSNSQDSSQEQTTFTTSNNNQSVTKAAGELSSSPVSLSQVRTKDVESSNNNKETELLLGKSQVPSTSVFPSFFSSSSRSNRRKSSEDYKDLRKNATTHSNGTPPFITTPETGKRRSILEDIQVELEKEEGVVPPSGSSLLSIGKRSGSSKSLLNDNANPVRDYSDAVKGLRSTRSASEIYAEQLKQMTTGKGETIGKRERTESQQGGDSNEVETDDPETACTESFRQLKPFNYDLEPVEEGKKERLYKVLVVGELGAGKTSIIKRYVHQFFSQHYRATIGVDFALKVLRWDPDTVVRLQLWDIAGQERFGSMTRVYYKEAVGAFVVFDVTRSATLEAVPKWKADLDAKVALPDGRPIPTVLLANKSDQPKEGIAANREKMNEFCQQQGFSAWFETSAKDNINIDESANFLVSKILEMDKWSQEPLAPDPDKVELTANGKHKGAAPSNCAC